MNQIFKSLRISRPVILIAFAVAAVVVSFDFVNALLVDAYTRSVEVSLHGVTSADARDIQVERLRLQPERAHFGRIENSYIWRTETGLTRSVFITLPEAAWDELQAATLRIGGREFAFTKEQLRAEWDVTQRDGRVSLEAPQAVRVGVALPIPLVGELRNVATGVLLLRILLLGLASVLLVLVWNVDIGASAALLRSGALVAGVIVLAVSLIAHVPVFGRSLALLLALSWVPAASQGAPGVQSGQGRACPLPVGRRSVSIEYLLLVAVGVLLASHVIHLGTQHMWRDEFFSFAAARTILQQGDMVFPSGFDYGRAPIYHTIVAASMKLFGENELGSRLPNILFNVLSAAVLVTFLRRRGFAFAAVVTLVWLSTNVTLAVTRTTRMYGMLTLTFLLVVVSFYLAVVDPPRRRTTVKLPGAIRINYLWLGAFLLSFALSWHVQRLTAVFIFGVALWWLLGLVFLKRKAASCVWLGFTLAAIVFGAWYRAGSVNLLEVYFVRAAPGDFSISDLDPLHYLSHIGGSVVLFAAVFPAAFLLAAVRRDRLIMYLWGVFSGSLAVLSFQHFVANRYVSFLFPLVAVILVYMLWQMVRVLSSQRVPWIAIGLLLVAVGGVHASLYVTELSELESYTEDSIRKKKKRQFNDVADYVRASSARHEYLVADNGAAYVLASKDLAPDYILLEPRRAEGRFAHQERHGYEGDRYTGIPYIVLGSEELNSLLREERVLLVIDNEESLPELEGAGNLVDRFDDPHVLFSPKGAAPTGDG